MCTGSGPGFVSTFTVGCTSPGKGPSVLACRYFTGGGGVAWHIVQESCVQEVFAFLGWEVDLVAIFTTNNTWMCRT